MEGVLFGGDTLELDGRGDGVDAVEDGPLLRHLLHSGSGGGSGQAGRRLLALAALDLLLGGLVGGIDGAGAHELLDSAGEVAGLAQDAAAIDVLGGGEEAHALEVGEIAEVPGFLLVGLLVVLVGGVVIFTNFGVGSTLTPGSGGLSVGSGSQDAGQADECQDKEEDGGAGEEVRPTAHAGWVRFLCTVRDSRPGEALAA